MAETNNEVLAQGLNTKMPTGVAALDMPAFALSKPTPEKVREQQFLVSQQKQEALGKQLEAEQAVAERKATGMQKIAGEEAQRAKEITETVDVYERENPAPELTPTKDNVQSLSTLFGLIGVIGMAMGGSGKQSATMSLNAMGGMMKGWREGRADLWKREVQEFDKNTLAWKNKLDSVYKKAQNLYKMLPYERQKAEAELSNELAVMGSSILKQKLEVQGFEEAYKSLEGMHKDAVKVVTDAGVERRHQEDLAFRKAEAAAREKRESQRHDEVLARLEQKGSKITPDRYGFNSIVATNMNEAINSINNIVNLPETSTTGTFQGRNTQGLLYAPIGGLTNRLTSEDVQRYNVEIGNFGKFISRVVAGGRVVPASVQKDFEEQFKVRDGDKPLTVLTKLAQMRAALERAAEVKIAEEGTDKGLKEIYVTGLDVIQKAIPFTVNDVNRIALEKNKKKTFSDMFKQFGLSEGSAPAPNAKPEQTTYDSAQAVKDAYKAGKISKSEASNILVNKFGYQQ